MEKLQPIIKQMFWILFGLALILILWAWWTASSALSAAITEGDAKVQKSYQDSKQPVDSVANRTWTDGAVKENTVHEIAYSESARELWKQQLNARVYPGKISKELSAIEYGGTIEREVRGEFAKLYRRYFNEQLETIKPFVQGEGLVEVNYGGITQENENRWRTSPPTSTEIWEAQEDIWLLRSIYDAIAEVNAGADTITKSTIRSLQRLELRGGDPDTEPGASAAGGGGFGGPGYEGGGYEGGMMMGGPPGGAAVGGASGASGAWTAFQGSSVGDLLVEEFGAVAGGGMMGGGMMGGGMPGYEGGSSYEGGGFDGGGAAAVETKRYVDDSEELPYKTRAFFLQVRMVQQRVPALLAALTNSSFPIEIVRVDASFGTAIAGTSGVGMGGMGGMSGMDPGYEDSAGGGPGIGMTPFGGGGASPFGGGPSFGGGGPGLGGPQSFGGPRTGLGAGKKGKTKRPDPLKSGFYATAMADPNLSTIRVAGLMTLYESKEEKEAIEDAEKNSATEAQDTEGIDLPDVPELGTDPTATETDPATEPTEMEGQPADGADATSAAAEPTGTVASDPVSPDGPPPATEPGNETPATE